MEALILLIFEAFLISILIIFFHRLKIYFGTGLLFIFIGSLQFYQSILASYVYNKLPGGYVISPGSTVIFTSTLFAILLIFHTDIIIKTRTLIYGLLISNIAITLLSILTSYQINLDNSSSNVNFLKNILNNDLTIFTVGACLLFFDAMLLIMIYQYLNFKMKFLPLLLKLYIPLVIVAFLDSVFFYSANFFSIENNDNLLISNIIGKQITVIVFSLIGYAYLKLTKKEENMNKAESFDDVLSIFTFR